jgi:hypothetical protein
VVAGLSVACSSCQKSNKQTLDSGIGYSADQRKSVPYGGDGMTKCVACEIISKVISASWLDEYLGCDSTRFHSVALRLFNIN